MFQGQRTKATMMHFRVQKAFLLLRGMKSLVLMKLSGRFKSESGSASVKPTAADDLVS